MYFVYVKELRIAVKNTSKLRIIYDFGLNYLLSCVCTRRILKGYTCLCQM